MNNTRTLLKKIIYKTFGEDVYAKAYARGKIKDIKNGTMSEAEFTFMSHFLTKNSTVLDIGANYGHYAIALAELCPQGRVHAFEPIDFTYKILEQVCKKFNLPNITTYHAAASNENGVINMKLPLLDFGAPNTGVAFIGENDDKATKNIEVKKISIDDLNLGQKVDFIKIDIEGHEPNAFEGMKNILLNDKPVVLIEFSHPCLNRAGTLPGSFATAIRSTYKYDFVSLQRCVKVN